MLVKENLPLLQRIDKKIDSMIKWILMLILHCTVTTVILEYRLLKIFLLTMLLLLVKIIDKISYFIFYHIMDIPFYIERELDKML